VRGTAAIASESEPEPPTHHPRQTTAEVHAPGDLGSVHCERRVGKAVGYPPLCDMSDLQRREFHEALLDADAVEDLPGKWHAAILKAEENRPNLRIVGSD
jgi:hypothetical protein